MIFYRSVYPSFDNGRENNFKSHLSGIRNRIRMNVFQLSKPSKHDSVKLEQQGPLLDKKDNMYWIGLLAILQAAMV